MLFLLPGITNRTSELQVQIDRRLTEPICFAELAN